MTLWYLDTSAAIKLVAEEPESSALANILDRDEPTLVGCLLLETELRRVAHRGVGLSQSHVSNLLEGVDLYGMPPSLYREAGLLPGRHLRSLDALHLAAAIRIGVDILVTYDARLSAGATELGLHVLAPA